MHKKTRRHRHCLPFACVLWVMLSFLSCGIYIKIYTREDMLYLTTIFLAVILSLRMRQRGSSFTFER